ncbi:MAG: TIGR03915 family putative DNA repair protein [Bryobacteraceae bacterium]
MTFEGWREQARAYASAGIEPQQLMWADSQDTLFEPPLITNAKPVRVPKEFLELAGLVALHREEKKWSLLYRVLYRLTHGEKELLLIEIDDDVRQLTLMRKEVTRDMHKMKAFVRFRKVGEDYIAWHRPDHLIVERMAPWFVARFGAMRWTILTPDRTAHWDTNGLRLGPGARRSDAPDGDALEELWKSYYAAIFNPARVNVKAMVKELPIRHWATLPEAELIPGLLADASRREQTMCAIERQSAAPYIPAEKELPVLREAVQGCRGCDLWETATQAVFGEGPQDASLMFVAEQPGDQEDRRGRHLSVRQGRSSIELCRRRYPTRARLRYQRGEAFSLRGKGKAPHPSNRYEVTGSGLPALVGSGTRLVRPKLVVAMGRTAALSVIGREVRLLQERGKILKATGMLRPR